MKAIRKTDQGGSAAAFILVGIILAVGLIGTVFYLKQHGEEVREGQQISTEKEEKSDKKSETDKSTSESANVNTKTVPSPTETASTLFDLPTTGPESSIYNLIGVFLLTVAVSGYFSSKRYSPRYL